MELKALKSKLQSTGRVIVDTSCFIYLFEDIKKYKEIAKIPFLLAEEGKAKILISPITIAEILTKPIENDDVNLKNEYITYFNVFPNLEIIDISYDISLKAAELRANHKLRTPDAFQLGLALQEKAIFMTNDKKLKKVGEVEILLLSDYS